MTLNIPLARKVLEFAEAEHRDEDFAYEQSYFWMTREYYLKLSPGAKHFWDTHYGPRCQTAACLAGTALMLDPDTEVEMCIADGNYRISVAGAPSSHDLVGRAREVLGLTLNQTQDLFFTGDPVTARARLRHYIEEAEADEAGL